MRWKEWAGYYSVEKYDTVHENEYFGFRHTAGLLDVSPLYKYDVTGAGALQLLDRVMARDVSRLKVGQVAYSCWCDEDGKVIDDGTLWRLGDEHYRITSANPCYRWLHENAFRLPATITDVSTDLAAVALQGPKSLDVLLACSNAPLDRLKYFWLAEARLGAVEAVVTRTGYTGDLGYEIWVRPRDAEALWDTLMKAGAPHGIMPAGLNALDMTRIEAGFILIDVDYTSSHHALIEDQKSSPFEIGLGWTVHLDKAPFIGQAALRREKARGSKWAFIGLEIDTPELERYYDAVGLPPSLPTMAWRSVVPLYETLAGRHGRQVGRATSGVWSPTLKKNLALATVEMPYAKVGTELKIEEIVYYDRKYVTARVVDKPFFDPPRKKALATRSAIAHGVAAR
jgi:aminomethyltransferase